MNYINDLQEQNHAKGRALGHIQRDINSMLAFLDSAKFTGTDNGERKDWISTADLKHFLIELRQATQTV